MPQSQLKSLQRSDGRKELVKVDEGTVALVDLRLEIASVEASVTVPVEVER